MVTFLLINNADGPDYLADMLYHCFYAFSLIRRVSVHVLSKPPYLYDDFSAEQSLYGRGFTVYRKLSRTKDVIELLSSDQAYINIRNNIYQYVIFLSVQRCALFSDLARVSSRINFIFCDGEDNRLFHPAVNIGLPYFKRELDPAFCRYIPLNVRPIGFAYPDQARVCHYGSYDAINLLVRSKTQFLATCDPRYINSYIYNSESAYYKGYQNSFFAVTKEKGGWDCLRHYEIIFNLCLPVFLDFEDKPALTMAHWPSELQLKANSLFLQMMHKSCWHDDLLSEYTLALMQFYAFAEKHLLTSHMLKHLLVS